MSFSDVSLSFWGGCSIDTARGIRSVTGVRMIRDVRMQKFVTQSILVSYSYEKAAILLRFIPVVCSYRACAKFSVHHFQDNS